MKTHFKTILAAMLLACTGCTDLTTKSFDNQQPAMAMSIVGDLTDKNLMQAKPDEIEGLLPIHDNTLYDGYIFRTRAIDEAENHEINQYEVKPKSYWTGEDQERIGQLKAFKVQVNNAIEKLEGTEIKPRKISRVYQAVCGELTALKTTNSKQQILLIMSDMLHNEPEVFSFYNKNDYNLAKTNPQAAATCIQRGMPLPKMSGAKVYIIHRPQSYQEQKMFDVAVRVFTLMLTQAGCKVYVSPNIVSGNEYL